MMDELELLKKDWQKKEAELPKLSFDQIYQMIWKKSSSVVKWIFIISLIEFIVPQLIYLIPAAREGLDTYEKLGLKNAMLVISIVPYAIALYFIYQFYQRYKEISVLDNAKNLMHKILKTRRTVKHYIIWSLSMFFITFIAMAIGIYFSEDFVSILNLEKLTEEMSVERLRLVVVGVLILLGMVVTVVVGAIYFLLYGLLLRKLGRNYKELKRLEV